MQNNKSTKDVVGIAISGQDKGEIKVDYFLKKYKENTCIDLLTNSSFLSLENINRDLCTI